MANFKKFLWTLAALPLLVSCSDDLAQADKDNTSVGVDANDGVYMSITMEMASPVASRSQTNGDNSSNGGTEVGHDFENNVSNAIIVIAERNTYNLIAAGTVQNGGTLTVGADNSYKATAKISKTTLGTYYDNNSEGGVLNSDKQEVNIFAFCNPTTDLLKYFFNDDALKSNLIGSNDWVNVVCKVEVESPNAPVEIWQDNAFLMSNISIATRALPLHLDDWDSFDSSDRAFDFSGDNLAGTIHQVDNSSTTNRGNISVERVCARFDFKDGSDEGDNTYTIYSRVSGEGDTETSTPVIKIQLQRMILTNMCNQFYYLPRVSNTGQPAPAAGYQLCGAEKRSNYMVGPYAGEYNNFTESATPIDPATYMNFPFFNVNPDNTFAKEFSYNGNDWKAVYEIKDVLGSGALKDNYDGSYVRWRYVTENIIPAEPENQVNGISTGVVFKGKLIGGEALNGNGNDYDQKLYNTLNQANGVTLTGNPGEDPIIYLYNNTMYCGWDAVVNAALSSSIIFDDSNNTKPQYITETITVDGEEKEITYLNVKRQDPFYIAVFGSGAIGKFKWNGVDYTDDTASNGETLAVDQTSANYLWSLWYNNGAPIANRKLAMANAMTKNGFTIYQSSTDNKNGKGYYCYYYYWNRHNDNLQPGVMGPMEFCVVRNNVYKLAVTAITRPGHPREPENDPNSPKPDTPDESNDIYFTVTCEVLPWVVRVNDIVF